MILDGKKIAAEIYSSLKIQVQELPTPPTLGIVLIWSDPVSMRYIGQKEKWAKYLGINFELYKFPIDISEEHLKQEIQNLNQNPKVSGYIIQFPLPKTIDLHSITQEISPLKDVDWFHPENQGKTLIGDTSGLTACTPAGVMELLSTENIDVVGKHVVVLWKSNIVGKPLTMLLINAGATVTSCNSKTSNISTYTKHADIVISATGIAGIITKDIIQESTIVIDVGFSLYDGVIMGDANFTEIHEQGNLITPVPGGVGPMTVAMLMKNTITTHKRQLWIL